MNTVIFIRRVAGISVGIGLIGLCLTFYSQIKVGDVAETNEVIANEKWAKARELYEQARLKGASGSYDEAIIGLNELIRFEPSYAEAYILRGHAKYLNGSIEEALKDYRLAASVYESNGEPEKASVPLSAIDMHYEAVERRKNQGKTEIK